MDLRDSDFFENQDQSNDIMSGREMVIRDDGSVILIKHWYYPQ